MLVVCEPDQCIKHLYTRRDFNSVTEESVDTVKNGKTEAKYSKA